MKALERGLFLFMDFQWMKTWFDLSIKVKNDYQSVAEGKDKQIEAAVKHLLGE